MSKITKKKRFLPLRTLKKLTPMEKKTKKTKKNKYSRKKQHIGISFLLLLIADSTLIKNDISVGSEQVYENLDINTESCLQYWRQPQASWLVDHNIYAAQTGGTKIIKWKINVVWLSNREMNREIKSMNGNIFKSPRIKIMHWNAGSKKWDNKRTQIESLLVEKSPELLFISEANLWDDLSPEDRYIKDYEIHYPNTMDNLSHSRLILLAKPNLNLQIMTEKVNKEAAMIWCKIGSTKKASVVIGGLYRQHLLLGQNQGDLPSATLLRNQEKRWDLILKKWKKVSEKNKVYSLG